MTNNNEILAGLLGMAIMFLIIIAVTSIPAWIFLAIYTGIGVVFGNALQLDAYDEQYQREQHMLDDKQMQERKMKFEDYQLKAEEYKAIQQTGIWIKPEYREKTL